MKLQQQQLENKERFIYSVHGLVTYFTSFYPFPVLYIHFPVTLWLGPLIKVLLIDKVSRCKYYSLLVSILFYSQASTQFQIFTGRVLTNYCSHWHPSPRNDSCAFAPSLSSRPFHGDAAQETHNKRFKEPWFEQPRWHEHRYKNKRKTRDKKRFYTTTLWILVWFFSFFS